MSARAYLTWGGLILLALGVAGYFATDDRLAGLNSDPLEDWIHIGAGGLFVVVGLIGAAARPSGWARLSGAAFLIAGVVGFLSPQVYGLFPSGLAVADNAVHLLYGVLGAWVGISSSSQSAGNPPKSSPR